MRQSIAAAHRALRAAAAAALVALGAACADGIDNPIGFSAKPEAAEPQSGSVRAWRYSLPKGVFFASLYEVGRDVDGVEIAFLVRIEGPVYVPDPDQSHTLIIAAGPAEGAAHDVRFYEDTPFLRVISFAGPPSALDFDDGSTEAETGGDAAEPGRRVAGPVPLDILSASDRARVASELEDAIRDFARRIESSTVCTEPFYTKPAICIEARIILDDLENTSAFGVPYISVSVDTLPAPRLPDAITLAATPAPVGAAFETADAPVQASSAAVNGASSAPSPEAVSAETETEAAPAPGVAAAEARAPQRAADGRARAHCSAGFCYRPLRRYNVTLRMGPALRGGPLSDPWLTTFEIALPNESPVVVAPIEVERLSAARARVLFGTPGAPTAVIANQGGERSGADRRAFDPTAPHLAGGPVAGSATRRTVDPSAAAVHDLVYPRSVERTRAAERPGG